jgi:hypothetical protein
MSEVTPIVSVLGVGLFTVFVFRVTSNGRAGLRKDTTLASDAMFLLNVLVMCLFEPRTWVTTYVWVILPVALFLSHCLTGEVKTRFLTLVCFAAVLMNTPDWLYWVLGLNLYVLDLPVPTVMIGSMLMIVALIAAFLRPNITFHSTA